ncbi:MAG: hypothetical protein JWN52_193 [Actinomycetia bacterium]|nr:hypothetical protein [Actinomycetes bacterium]
MMRRDTSGRHRAEDIVKGLQTALRDEAERHEPDRDRMLARIAEGTRTRPGGPRRVWLLPTRAIGVALATAGVITVATIGGWQLVERQLSSRVASQTETSSPSAIVRPSRPTSAPASSNPVPVPGPLQHGGPKTSPPAGPPSAVPSPRPTGPAAVRVSAVLDPQSSDYWAQANLALTVVRPLTKLTVTIQVARTAGAAFHGSWMTLPIADLTSQMTTTTGAIVYRWELKPGRAIQPGTYRFGAQYDRFPGTHDLHRDTFTLAVADSGPGTTVRGHY